MPQNHEKKCFSIIVALLIVSHVVNAQTPQTLPPCPGCLIQLPWVEVSDTANPTHVAYRNLLNGKVAFKEYRAYAPRAELRFVVQPQSPGEILSGLTVSIVGAEMNLPLQLDKDGIFELPRLEELTATGTTVVVNRREGTIRLRPSIHSQSAAVDGRRIGDLRLECEITWAMEKDELSFLARGVLKLIGGLCGSSQSKVSFRVAKKLLGANLLLGDRKSVVPIDKTGYAFSPPLHDRSWPDDAIIALEFEKG